MSDSSLGLMIIGAQKAGTSSLLFYMGQGAGLLRHNPPEIDAFISAATDHEASEAYEQAFSPAETGVRIAKHATLMYHPDGLARLLRLHPNCHLAAVLRNPLDRAYSSYWFRRGRGLELETSFEAALEADQDRAGDYRSATGRVGYVEHGLYAKYLAPIYATPELEGLHVYTLEELKNGPAALCRDLASKIGVPAEFDHLATEPRNAAGRSRAPAISRWLNGDARSKKALGSVLPPGVASALARRTRRSARVRFQPPTMSQETREQIAPLFADDIVQLAALVDKPSFLTWLP